jgi:phosphohistidine phosphatase SixA
MGDDCVTACREAGLTHFVLVRHANAAPLRSGAAVRKDAPHDWKIDDQMRPLTPKGLDQCNAAGTSWFSMLPLRALLSSPARRAAETASFMAQHYETEEKKVSQPSRASRSHSRAVSGAEASASTEGSVAPAAPPPPARPPHTRRRPRCTCA